MWGHLSGRCGQVGGYWQRTAWTDRCDADDLQRAELSRGLGGGAHMTQQCGMWHMQKGWPMFFLLADYIYKLAAMNLHAMFILWRCSRWPSKNDQTLTSVNMFDGMQGCFANQFCHEFSAKFGESMGIDWNHGQLYSFWLQAGPVLVNFQSGDMTLAYISCIRVLWWFHYFGVCKVFRKFRI